MELKMFKDAALSLLKRDIDDNRRCYLKNTVWLDDYFKSKQIDNYYINTGIYVDNFKLELGDGSHDARNAVIVHKAMKNLLPIQAREEKLWSYLAHSYFYDYMKSRWKVDTNSFKRSKIESRYFFPGKNENKIKSSTVPYVRNGLSRLWWAGYIVYDESSENPYEYIDELFVSQDMFVGLCERDIAKNKTLVLSILKNVRKYKIKDIPKNTDLVRSILKDINFSAGLIVYDALDEKTINNKVEEIFKSNLKI